MILLILGDPSGLFHFLFQPLVGILGIPFPLLHDLNGEGIAEDPADHIIKEDGEAPGCQFLPGVPPPDFSMGLFLPGDPQQGLPVCRLLHPSGQLPVNGPFCNLAVLKPQEDLPGLPGNVLLCLVHPASPS